MFHLRPALMLTPIALLLCAGGSHAAAPKPDFADLPAYLSALNASPDPAAKAIRAEIADGPAALTRERAACAKLGLPTTLAQLNQPLPPASENAAPLYVQWDALRKDKPLPIPRIPGKIVWPLNARYDYPPGYLAKVRAMLAARPDYTTLLDQATDRPRCVFAMDWTKFPATDQFTHFAGLREAARTYSFEGFLLAKEGRFAEAVTTQARGFTVTKHVTDSSPLLIGFLVAVATDAIAVSGMQDTVQMAGPNAAVDAQAQAALAAPASSLSLSQAIGGECASADGLFLIVRQAPPADFHHLVPADSPYQSERLTTQKQFTPAQQAQVTALIDASEALTLSQTRALYEAAKLPRTARDEAFIRMQIKASDLRDDPVRILAAPISIAAQGLVFNIGGIADRSMARHAVAAAGAAVLAARAQTGAFPDTLPAGLTDPFTGKPLGYRREGTDGFVIYSVGADGDFTGGKPGDKPAFTEVSFRYPAPPPEPLPAVAEK